MHLQRGEEYDNHIWKPTQNFISSSVFPNEITIIYLCCHYSTVCPNSECRVRRPSQQSQPGAKPSQSSSWAPRCPCIYVQLLDSGGFPYLLILLQMSAELRRIKLQLLHIHFRISYPLTDSERGTELASLPQEFRSECNRARQKWSLLSHRSRKTDGFLSMADFSLPSKGHPLEYTDRPIITTPTRSHTTSVILNQSLSNVLICHMRGIGISKMLEDRD